MTHHYIKYHLIMSMSMLCLLSSCSLFTEDLPKCLKESRKDPSSVTHCDQPIYFSAPDWHPDGEWIAVDHVDSVDTNNDGDKDTRFSGIWLVHAETGLTQPLLPFGDNPDWSPDGTQLVVHTGAGIFTVKISSLEPAQFDTASVNQLTTFGQFASWSGDGQWIAFDTNYQDAEGANVIWKIRKDGTDLTDISIHQVGEWRKPNWSESGNSIVHERYVKGGAEGQEIFVMRANGSNPNQLTKNGENHAPKFSPDGQKIAFFHRNKYKSHIVVMKTDGSNKRKISNNWSQDPAWSPDGEKIVYMMSNQFHERPGNGQLWIMNANGNNKKQLTDFKPSMP